VPAELPVSVDQVPPMCTVCDRQLQGFNCEAFPDGIPDDIFEAKTDHRSPVPGDRGLQFVKMRGVSNADIARVLRHYE